MSNPKLSVVIPAYNEVENLKKGVLDQVSEYLSKQSYENEVVIVDDGSTDETVKTITDQIKDKKNFRLIKNPHSGKAITVMTGLLQSKGEIVLFTDMDQATPLSEIEKFFSQFKEGYEVVIGTRVGRKGAPLIRKFYVLCNTILRFLFLGITLDTQCGFKAYSRKAATEIFSFLLKKWNSMKVRGAAVNAGWDMEQIFIAKRKGFKIIGVPVSWHYVGTERVGIGAALEAVKDLLRIKVGDLMGEYK